MTRDDITDIKIEKRGRTGAWPIWNITMFVTPKSGKTSGYSHGEMMTTAQCVLSGAKDLKPGNGWYPCNGEVMAWSSTDTLESRGIACPHRYRVTLDMCNKKGSKHEREDEPDED